MCSDPSTKEASFGWTPEQCTPKLYPAAKGEYLKDAVAGMKRLNVTAVVFGDAATVHQWMDAYSGHVIPGTGFEEGMQGRLRACTCGKRNDSTWSFGLAGSGRNVAHSARQLTLTRSGQATRMLFREAQ